MDEDGVLKEQFFHTHSTLAPGRHKGFNGAMTEILAQKDSYLKEFEATVVAVDRENGAVALAGPAISSRSSRLMESTIL